MSAPDPAKRPLLFPDPVIEYYIERVDRAAIRERLQMTPEARLQALQREVNARAANQPARVREEPPNEPAPPLKLAGEEFRPPPSKVPMLFPDPVIEAYAKDVDRTILRQNLRRTVPERLANFVSFMKGVYGLRGGGAFRPEELWEQHSSNAGQGPAN